jgi:hypothetical protein
VTRDATGVDVSAVTPTVLVGGVAHLRDVLTRLEPMEPTVADLGREDLDPAVLAGGAEALRALP